MTPRLRTLAKQIEIAFPDLGATIERGFCNTDRHIPGTRLRHIGRGRYGNKLVVRDRTTGEIVFSHNAADTYRYNWEVVDWIADEKRRRGR